MAGFAFDPNAIFNFDDVDANFEMYPDVFGEEEGTNTNQGTTSHSGEGAVGDPGVGNLINHDNEPFMGLGALMTNNNFDPTRPVSEDNDPFMAVEAPTATTYDNSDPDHGQTQHQQFFEESVGLSQNAGLAPETNQVAANVSGVEEEDWFKLTNQEQDEAFHRFMEMSPEAFEEMMRGFPAEEITALGLPSATPYADTKKRVRLDEEGSASTLVGGAPSIPQLDFELHQIQQIRQIREAKSSRGKAIEALEKRVQDLVADLAKAQSEAKDAFENGRMAALLGVDESWDAREAMLKNDAQAVHEQQISAVRNLLEGQIAEKDEQLARYRTEAEEYKTSVEGEAEKYKQAAEEEIKAQKAALEKRSKEINILREEGQKDSKELETSRQQVKAQSGEIASLQIRFENSESSNKEKDKKIASLQELLDSSSPQRSNSSHQEELKLLKEQLAESESFLNKARNENALLREHQARRELEDLQATSKMDNAAPTEADTELVQAMLEQEREKIEAGNSGRENRVNETLKRLEQTEQERRQMLKDELDRKEAELYDAQKRIGDLEQQLLASSSSESSQPPSQTSPVSAQALPLTPPTPPTPTPPAAGPSPSPQRSRLPGPRSLFIVFLIFFLSFFTPFLHSLVTSSLEHELVDITTREDRLHWEAWELADWERDEGVPTHKESWRRTQEVGEMGDWNPMRGWGFLAFSPGVRRRIWIGGI